MGGGNFTLSKKELETKVVEMKFDNSDFDQNVEKSIKTIDKLEDKLEFKDAGKNFKNIEDAASRVDISSLGAAFETVGGKISAMSVAGIAAIGNLTNRAVDAAVDIAKSLSVDQISAGYNKYESKTSSVQTLVNAGYELDEVNEVLDHLMWYSDETSYSFSDMTQALATAASQGLEIKDMIPVIEGMANATSFAGKGASEFSRVIFNLMQSFGTGSLQLIDWKSVNLAGVSSERLKESLIEAAEAMGTVEKGAITTGNFEDTLKSGWATTEVMMKAFSGWAEFTEEVYDNLDNYDSTSDAMEALSGTTSDYAESAMKAAQSAKSFTDAIEATKDAVSTGWLTTFDIIFGNINEATALWTDLTNALWDVFAAGGEVRNEILQEWKELGGRDTLIDAFWGVWDIGITIANALTSAFNNVFPLITAEQLYSLTVKIKKGVDNLLTFVNEHAPELTTILNAVLIIVKVVIETVKMAFKVFKPLYDQFFSRLSSGFQTLVRISQAVYDFIDAFMRVYGPFRILQSLKNNVIVPLYNIILAGRKLIKTALIDPFLSLFKISQPGLKNVNDGVQKVTNVIKAIGSVLIPVSNFITNIFEASETSITTFYSTIKSILGKIYSATSSLFVTISSVFPASFLAMLSTIGTAFKVFGELIKESFNSAKDKITEFFSNVKIGEQISNGFKKAIDAIKTSIEKLGNSITNLKTKIEGTLNSVKSSASEKVNPENNKFVAFFSNIFSKIKEFGNKIKDAAAPIFKRIGEWFANIDMAKLYEILGLVSGGGISFGIMSLLKSFNKFVNSGEGYVRSFTGIVDAFKGVITGFNASMSKITDGINNVLGSIEQQVKIDSFEKVAKAILMIAASIVLLSLIPKDKLAVATLAITELIAIVTGAIKILGGEKETEETEEDAEHINRNNKSLKSATTALLALSASVLIIAKALTEISKVDPGRLWQSFGALSALLAMLTGISVLFEKQNIGFRGNENGSQLAVNLLALSVSLLVISKALKAVSNITNVGTSVTILASVLSVMILFFKAADNIKKAIKNAYSCAVLSISILPIVAALYPVNLMLQKFGYKIWESIGILGSILLLLVGFLRGISGVKKAISASFSVLILTMSLLPITATLAAITALLTKFSMPELLFSVGVMGLTLLSMATAIIAIGKLSKHSITSSLSVLAMTFSFIPIVVELALLSKLIQTSGIGTVLQSVGILGGTLLLMAATLIALGKGYSKLIQGAIAVDLLALSFLPMVTALSMLSVIPAKALMTAVGVIAACLALVVAFGIIGSKAGLAASLLQLSIAFMAFAGATLVMSTAILTFMSAMIMLSTAIIAFAALDSVAITAAISAIALLIAAALDALGPLLEKFIDLIADILIIAADKLLPAVVKFIKMLVNSFIIVINSEIPRLSRTFLKTLITITDTLKEAFPIVLDTLAELLAELYIFIYENGQTLADTILTFLSQILVSISDNSESWKESLKTILSNIWEVVIESIYNLLVYVDEHLGEWLDTMWGIISQILSFIGEKTPEFVSTAIQIVLDIIAAIGEKLPDVIQTGVDFVLSLLEGINSAIENNKDDFIKAVDDLVYNIVDVVISVFEAWPELLFRIGKRILYGDEKGKGGLIPGLKKYWPLVKQWAKNTWDKVVNWFKGIPEWFKDAGEVIITSIKDGFNNKIDEIGDALTGIGRKIKEGWEDFWDINSPSKVMEKDGEYLVLGAAKGVDKNADILEDSVENLGDGALSKMQKVMKGVNDTIDDDMDINPTISPIVDLTNVQNGAKAINGIMSDGFKTNVDISKTATRTGTLASSIDANKIGSLNFTPVGGSENVSNITNNFTINGGGDPNVVADKVSKILQKQVDRRNATWA